MIDINEVLEHPLDYVYEWHGKLYEHVKVFRPNRCRTNSICFWREEADGVGFYSGSLRQIKKFIERGTLIPIRKPKIMPIVSIRVPSELCNDWRAHHHRRKHHEKYSKVKLLGRQRGQSLLRTAC